MPFVEVHWYEGRSDEQKAEIAKRVESALIEVAGVPPEHCWVKFSDSSKSDFIIGEPADDFLRDRPVLEQQQGRDREDFVLGGSLLVLVDVEAEDRQVVALGIDLFEHRMDDAARAAPRSPEVDEHGTVGLDHVGFEVGVCHVGELACH